MTKQPNRIDALDAAQLALGGLTPTSPDDKTDIDQAILTINRIRARRSGTAVRKVRRNGRLVPAEQPSVVVTPLPRTNPFYGMGIREAAPEVLRLTGRAMLPKEIWEFLQSHDFLSAHNDPPRAVHAQLSRRAKTHCDVLLVGDGKWDLKSRYTEEQLEEIRKSVGGMAGRDRVAHSEQTRNGLLLARSRGARIGQPVKLSPEKVQEVDKMISEGIAVSKVAEHFGVSRATIYNRLKDLRAQLADAANRVMN